MRMTKDELAAVVLREIEEAQGYDSDVLASKRAGVLDLYQGLFPAPPAKETGRSGVVSLDVADSVHALLAQMGPVLKSSLIEFEPESAQDVAQAQTETNVLRKILERSDAYGCVAGATHDALLIGNGWLALSIEDYSTTRTQRLPLDVPAEALAMLPEDATLSRGENWIEVTQTYSGQRLMIESVPPEDMLVSNEPGVEDLQKLRLVARRRLYTQAALLDMGISREVVEAIPDATTDYPAERARQGIYGDQTIQSVQDATRLKAVWCCYVLVDSDDKGRATERREVWVGGQELLRDDPADYVPFVTGSPVVVPHRIIGMGVGELVGQIQASKTHTLRAYLDNLDQLVMGRTGVLEGDVTMGDLLQGRAAGVIRMKRPDAIFPLPVPDVGGPALAGLGYMDQVRGQRVGAALDQTEVQAQLMSASATAAAGQLAQVEMMGGWFASNLAETLLKRLYLLAHRMLRDTNTPVMAQQQGQWVEVYPSEWPERYVASVTMGLTTAQRTQRQMTLQMVVQQLQGLLTSGMAGQLTDLSRYFNAMSDWLRASGLSDPDQYLIDPASPQAQQAAAQQQQAQQAEQQQAMQLQVQIAQMTHGFEMEKQQAELEYKRWSDLLKAHQAEAEMEIRQAEVEGNATLEALRIRNEAAGRDADRAVQAAGERAKRLEEARSRAGSESEGGDE